MAFEVQAENVFPNPSLEEGYIMPLGWESSSGEGVAWSDKWAHSGKRSLLLTGNRKENRCFLKLPVKKGRKYRFSCYLKAEGIPVDDGGFLSITWTRHGAAIDNEWGYPTKNSSKSNRSEWEKVSVTSQSDGAGVKGVLISLVGPEKGNLWADDFAVEDLGPAEGHDGNWHTLDEGFFELEAAPESPHIKWATQYAGKKPRILFIYPFAGGREIIETKKRFDFEYELAYIAGYNLFAPTEFYSQSDERFREERISARLKSKLKLDYDVIVIGQINWMILPEEIRDVILEKVKGGTGLFYSYAPVFKEHFEKKILSQVKPVQNNLTNKIPWQKIPALKNYDSAKKTADRIYFTGTLGKGRVAVLKVDPKSYQFMTPGAANDELFDPLFYEYFQAYLAHLLCWLSNSSTALTIESVDVSDEILQAQVEGSHVTLRIGSTEKDVAKGELTCTIRSGGHDTLAPESTETVPLSLNPGANDVTVSLPFLKTGTHFLEFKLRSAGKVSDWRIASFDVNGPNRIKEVKLDKDSYRAGETVSGAVILETATRGFSLRLKVQDSYDRLIYQSTTPIHSSLKIPFGFNLELPRANLFHVSAELVSNDRIYSTARTFFGCPEIDRMEYRMGAWFPPVNDYISQLALTQFRAVGVDIVDTVDHGNFPYSGYNLAKHNLGAVIYGSNAYRYQGSSNVKPDKWCITSKRFKEKERTSLEVITGYYAPFGIHGFSLGNDSAVSVSKTDCCFSETCQADLREYLSDKYETLDTLNRLWKSDFKTWADVHPVTLEDAGKTGHYTPWLDHRKHMDAVYTRTITETSPGWIHRIAPDVPVGIEEPRPDWIKWWSGTGSTKLYTANECWIPYHSLLDATVMNSFAKTWGFRGVWAGGYNWHRHEYRLRFYPWWILFNGYNSFMWFLGYYNMDDTNSGPLLTPQLTPNKDYLTSYEEVNEIKQGIGKLLINTPRAKAEIAIVVSQTSLYMNSLYPPWAGSEYWGWLRIFADQGYSVDFIAAEDIAGYSPKLKAYQVLCLPYMQSVSTEEAAGLKRFVKSGGVVIADVLPGVFDAHGRPYKTSPLDELFGIESDGAREPTYGEVAPNAYLGDKMLSGRLSETGVGKGIVVTSGSALASTTAGVPAIVYHEYGKGKAFYLNFFVPANPTPEYNRTFSQILSHVDVNKNLRLIDLDNETERAYGQINLWKSGDLELYGIMPHVDGDRDMEEWVSHEYGIPENKKGQRVVFQKRGHIYSLRDYKYHGYTGKIDINLKHGRAEVLARVPYEIKNIDMCVNDAKQSFRPGETVRFTISLKAGSRKLFTHCYHIELVDVDKKVCPWYTLNVMAGKGKYSGALPLALDTKPGTWRLIATEVISGKKAESRFEVR